jgi:hypothetical protein
MAGRDALVGQLLDALHGGGKLAIARISFLPLSLADQQGAGLAKRGSASGNQT